MTFVDSISLRLKGSGTQFPNQNIGTVPKLNPLLYPTAEEAGKIKSQLQILSKCVVKVTLDRKLMEMQKTEKLGTYKIEVQALKT